MDTKNPGVSDPGMLILDPGVSHLLLRRGDPAGEPPNGGGYDCARQRHHSRRPERPQRPKVTCALNVARRCYCEPAVSEWLL